MMSLASVLLAAILVQPGQGTSTTIQDVSRAYAEDVFAFSLSQTATSVLSTNNTLRLSQATISCSRFLTELHQTLPAGPLAADNTVVLNQASILASKTFYVGNVIGGQTLVATNGSTLAAGEYGLLLGVNSGLCCSNRLFAADSCLSLPGVPLTAGHADGSFANEIVLDHCAVTSSVLRVGGNTPGLNRFNSIRLRNNCSLEISSYYPFGWYGSNSSITLENTTFDRATYSDRFWAGSTLTCTGNVFSLERNATYRLAGLTFGGYTAESYPAIANVLFLGAGSCLDVGGQLMNSGVENTIVISNGTLSTHATTHRWNFYLGYSTEKDTQHEVRGNRLVFQGDSPLLKATHEGQETNDALAYIGNDSRLVFELPPKLAYSRVPIQVGTLQLGAATQLQVPNLDAARRPLTTAKDVVMAVAPSGLTLPWSAADRAHVFPALGNGCCWVIGETNLVLHVEPGQIARVGSQTYSSFDQAIAAALASSATLTLLAPRVDAPFVLDGRSLTLAQGSSYVQQNFHLLNGATLTCTGFNIGRSSQTAGSQVTACDAYLEIGDAATLNINGQFMSCGTNNTVVISNGTLRANTRYAIYFGHEYSELKGLSANNTLILRGQHPRIEATAVENADISVQNSEVRFELVPGRPYTSPVFESTHDCYIYSSCSVTFPNLDEFLHGFEEVTAPFDMPLVKTGENGLFFIGNASSAQFKALNATLPNGCYLWIDSTTSSLYLHVIPYRPRMSTLLRIY